MRNETISDHVVFWLGRYAHNTIAPLIAEARQYEPSIQLGIHMSFDHKDAPFFTFNHIQIDSHWKRDGMFFSGAICTSREEVDAVAVIVQKFIKAEQEAAA